MAARIDPKKVEKSASQGSNAGSVSSAAAAAKEKRKHTKGEGKDKKGESPSVSPAVSSVGVIKAPLTKKDTEASTGRRTATSSGAGGDKEKTEKGILKNKKSRTKSGGDVNAKKTNVKAKGKAKAHKRTFFENLALSLGFHVGEVVLTDPYAIEAAQALDLQQWHLRRLKMRFDKIDLDGSGNIDYDEFFESIGEMRSPFTDKLFALIGTSCALSCTDCASVVFFCCCCKYYVALMDVTTFIACDCSTDLDGSGTIEFDEYVRVMATYCMFTKDEILRFCFECFDVDRSGTIDEKEFVELCK